MHLAGRGQDLALRADVAIPLGVIGEVCAAEQSIRAVSAIAGHMFWDQSDALRRALDHCLRRSDFLGNACRRRLHVHNDRMLVIDEIVQAVSELNSEAPLRRPSRCRIGRGQGARCAFWVLWRVLAVERDKVFPYSPRLPRGLGPLHFRAQRALEAAGIRLDHRGVNGKSFATYKTKIHTALHNGLEHVPEKVTLAETPMAVLAERRVIGNFVFQSEPAEPTVGKVQRDFLAKPPLGPDAEAVADDQHPEHQFRIDRGPAGMAVKWRE